MSFWDKIRDTIGDIKDKIDDIIGGGKKNNDKRSHAPSGNKCPIPDKGNDQGMSIAPVSPPSSIPPPSQWGKQPSLNEARKQFQKKVGIGGGRSSYTPTPTPSPIQQFKRHRHSGMSSYYRPTVSAENYSEQSQEALDVLTLTQMQGTGLSTEQKVILRNASLSLMQGRARGSVQYVYPKNASLYEVGTRGVLGRVNVETPQGTFTMKTYSNPLSLELKEKYKEEKEKYIKSEEKKLGWRIYLVNPENPFGIVSGIERLRGKKGTAKKLNKEFLGKEFDIAAQKTNIMTGKTTYGGIKDIGRLFIQSPGGQAVISFGLGYGAGKVGTALKGSVTAYKWFRRGMITTGVLSTGGEIGYLLFSPASEEKKLASATSFGINLVSFGLGYGSATSMSKPSSTKAAKLEQPKWVELGSKEVSTKGKYGVTLSKSKSLFINQNENLLKIRATAISKEIGIGSKGTAFVEAELGNLRRVPMAEVSAKESITSAWAKASKQSKPDFFLGFFESKGTKTFHVNFEIGRPAQEISTEKFNIKMSEGFAHVLETRKTTEFTIGLKSYKKSGEFSFGEWLGDIFTEKGARVRPYEYAIKGKGKTQFEPYKGKGLFIEETFSKFFGERTARKVNKAIDFSEIYKPTQPKVPEQPKMFSVPSSPKAQASLLPLSGEKTATETPLAFLSSLIKEEVKLPVAKPQAKPQVKIGIPTISTKGKTKVEEKMKEVLSIEYKEKKRSAIVEKGKAKQKQEEEQGVGEGEEELQSVVPVIDQGEGERQGRKYGTSFVITPVETPIEVPKEKPEIDTTTITSVIPQPLPPPPMPKPVFDMNWKPLPEPLGGKRRKIKLFGSTKGFKVGFSMANKKGFAPSPTAIMLNLTGKQRTKGTFTGLEIRLIPKEEKKRRGKKRKKTSKKKMKR